MTQTPGDRIKKVQLALWGMANDLHKQWNTSQPPDEAYTYALRHLSGELEKALAQIPKEALL